MLLTQQRSQKKIIYLDQNWLSDLTKAVRLDGSSPVDKACFTQLYEVMQRAIAEDKIACPTSPHHMSESNFDSKRSADFRSVDNALSRGLSFNHSEQISHYQLLGAASRFAGVDFPVEPWWCLPFNRDPDTLDSTLPRSRTGIEVIVTFLQWVSEERRLRDQIQGPMYREYKDFRRAFKLSYQDEVIFTIHQLFREGYFRLSDALAQLGDTPADFGEIYHTAVLRQFSWLMEIKGICELGAGLPAFVRSSEFANVPYLSIRAKLMAADIVRNGRRNPENSLSADFDIAATVVPYVDVFATENYLAELLRGTRVANDCECSVFTMRQKDEFLDYVSRL